MKKEIKVTVFKAGGIINCEEKLCPYRSECANHTTAGDFRKEGGFTPEITKEGEKFFCETILRPDDYGFPENSDLLTHGSLFLSKQGTIELYETPLTSDTLD